MRVQIKVIEVQEDGIKPVLTSNINGLSSRFYSLLLMGGDMTIYCKRTSRSVASHIDCFFDRAESLGHIRLIRTSDFKTLRRTRTRSLFSHVYFGPFSSTLDHYSQFNLSDHCTVYPYKTCQCTSISSITPTACRGVK